MKLINLVNYTNSKKMKTPLTRSACNKVPTIFHRHFSGRMDNTSFVISQGLQEINTLLADPMNFVSSILYNVFYNANFVLFPNFVTVEMFPELPQIFQNNDIGRAFLGF